MNTSYFIRKFEYDRWANHQFVAALSAESDIPAKGVGWLAHIIAAQNIWQARIKNQDWTQFAVWPGHDIETCQQLIEAVSDGWSSWLNSHSDADLQVSADYQNTSGESFSTPIVDILDHVIIHGGYHRGQIAALIRQSGFAPPATDFVIFAR